MANRRMFCLDIVNSDAFLDMPCSAQNLYFHLAMRADDDGFIGNPNAITRLVNSSNEDLQLLKTKRFLLAFPNGIVVIKHWRIPYPTTWLNGRRWEDDLSGQSDTNDSEHSYSLNDYKSLVNNFGGMK